MKVPQYIFGFFFVLSVVNLLFNMFFLFRQNCAYYAGKTNKEDIDKSTNLSVSLFTAIFFVCVTGVLLMGISSSPAVTGRPLN